MAEDSNPERQDGTILVERHNDEQNVTANGGQDAPRGIASADMANDAAVETLGEGKHASSQDPEDAQKDVENPKPSKAKMIWGKLGLDLPTIIMMFKYAFFTLYENPSHKQQGIASTANWCRILSIA
jgi:hypothetical protein